MNIETRSLEALKPHPKNTRKHGELQIREFVRSVDMFGAIRPIVIDEDNTILAGHGLWEALKRLDKTDSPVLVVKGLSESQKVKLMMADNKIFQLGAEDYDMIDQILKEIDDFDIPGYSEPDLEAMYGDMPEVEHFDDFKMEEKEVKDRQKLVVSPEPLTPRKHYFTDDPTLPKEESEGEEIICPHCGEKVWIC